jgi:hypothetical protein
MCKLLVSTRWAALVFLAFAVFVLSAAGDEKPTADSPQPKPAKAVPKAVDLFGGDQVIMKTLDEPTDMDFVETPLKDVITAISIRHEDIPIVLDLKSITDAGSSADTPITFQLRGISLKSALRHMLREHGLDYVINDDVLQITSAESPTTLRQYDVADLVRDGTSIDSLAKAVYFALPRTSTAAQSLPGAGGPAGAVGVPGAASGPGGPASGGFGGGAPTSTEPDGEVMPFQSLLLVRATDRGHENVETFLAELRHRMSKHDASEKASGQR